MIVLPPGEWDPNIRIEPPKKVPSAEKRWVGLDQLWGGRALLGFIPGSFIPGRNPLQMFQKCWDCSRARSQLGSAPFPLSWDSFYRELTLPRPGVELGDP